MRQVVCDQSAPVQTDHHNVLIIKSMRWEILHEMTIDKKFGLKQLAFILYDKPFNFFFWQTRVDFP
jgi:hypothetical protein